MNYVHIRFTMTPDSTAIHLPDTASDRWVTDDSGRIEADEGDYDFAYRELTMFAWLTPDELAEMRNEWTIEPERAEPALGFLGDLGDGLPRIYDDERHSFDGMDWNVGGVTDVMFCDMSIIGPDAQPA